MPIDQRLRKAAAAAGIGFGFLMIGVGPVGAQSTTTSAPPPTTPATTAAPPTTAAPAPTTTRPVTSTTKPPEPDAGSFAITPTVGPVGSSFRIRDVNPRCPMPAGKAVQVAIGMGNGRTYGSHIIATVSPDATGSWGGFITVPGIPSGVYEMYASCFVPHPGPYDDELLLIYNGPSFTVASSSASTTPSTSIAPALAAAKSDSTPWVIGAIVAGVVALAAIIYAFVMRSRTRHRRPS